MANYDRANQDHDERDYDGGPDDDDNEGSHLPVVIIIAVIVLAAFGGVVWLAYNQGVARGRSDAPVRIAATTKPDDGGIKVYQQSAGPEEEAKPAPAPQAAAPAPQPDASTPEPSQSIQPPPPVQTAPTPAPAVVPPPPRIGQPQAAPAQPKPLPQAATVPSKPLPQAAAAKPYSQPATEEPAKPQVATKPPAQLGGAHPVVATAPATPPAAKPAPAKPASPPPAKAAAASGGSYMLQIGAFKSDAEARAAWKTYQSKHAALLNGFSSDIQQTTHDDGSIWYRLRIASFSDKDAAGALCDRLKSQGGACFLSK